MARNSAKWLRLVESRSRGKSWPDAAREAGYSLRHAVRLGAEQEFKEALAARVRELRDDDRAAFLEHRRRALRVAEAALAKQVELMQGGQVPAAVLERVCRSIQDHARALWPSMDQAELEQAVAELEGMVRLLASGRGLNGHVHVAATARLSPN
jgi:ferredoxin-NADP reductase